MNSAIWIGLQPLVDLTRISEFSVLLNAGTESSCHRTSRHGLRTTAAMLHGFVQICFALANITCDGGMCSLTTRSNLNHKRICSKGSRRLTCSAGVHLDAFFATFLSQRKH